jgi:hypothetical protein
MLPSENKPVNPDFENRECPDDPTLDQRGRLQTGREMKEVGFNAVCRKPAELTRLESMIFRLPRLEAVDGAHIVPSTAELGPTDPGPDAVDRNYCRVNTDATFSIAARPLRPFRRPALVERQELRRSTARRRLMPEQRDQNNDGNGHPEHVKKN